MLFFRELGIGLGIELGIELGIGLEKQFFLFFATLLQNYLINNFIVFFP
jgi:hypothetical protein